MNEKRTEFSKTIELDAKEKRFRLIVGPKTPLHYKDNYSDQSEEWKDINLTPQLKDGKAVVGRAPFTVEADRGAKMMYTSRKRGIAVGISLRGAADVVPEIRDNTIYWPDVFTDTDAFVSFRPVGVELFIKLKSASAPKTFTWEYLHDGTGGEVISPKVSGTDHAERICKISTDWRPAAVTRDGKTIDFLDFTFEDLVSKVTNPQNRIKEWSSAVTYPVVIDPTVNENITTDSTDDGDESLDYNTWRPDGLYSNVITVRFTDFYGSNVGLRFQTVDVPQGATINSATLTVQAMLVSGSITKRVYGDDVDDAPAFGAGNRPSHMTKTTAMTSFADNTTGVKNIDVTAIVQEIVDRAGWTNNNDMRFGIFPPGAGGTPFWRIADTGHATGAPATLAIDYTVGGGGGDPIKAVGPVPWASVKKIGPVVTANAKKILGIGT